MRRGIYLRADWIGGEHRGCLAASRCNRKRVAALSGGILLVFAMGSDGMRPARHTVATRIGKRVPSRGDHRLVNRRSTANAMVRLCNSPYERTRRNECPSRSFRLHGSLILNGYSQFTVAHVAISPT